MLSVAKTSRADARAAPVSRRSATVTAKPAGAAPPTSLRDSRFGVLQRKCACGGGCPRCQGEAHIQPKLAISEPGDAYEQEADRIAEQVMRMPDPLVNASPALPSVKPKCAACEDEEKEKLQREPRSSDARPSPAAPPIVHEVLRAPGQPLDAATRAFMEPRFAQDFTRVRVHTDETAAASARAVNALAYTVRRDVVFAADQYVPRTLEGKRLLAHELTHVVQQAGDLNRPAWDHRATPAGSVRKVETQAVDLVQGRLPAAGLQRQDDIPQASPPTDKETAEPSPPSQPPASSPAPLTPPPTPASPMDPAASSPAAGERCPTPGTSGVTGIQKADQDFSGRSTTRFGVGEAVSLSFSSPLPKPADPAKQAEPHGGLKWVKTAGPGSLAAVDEHAGTARFTADQNADTVELELRVLVGPCAGSPVAKTSFKIVKPDDGVLEQAPGTKTAHKKGKCSIGFLGKPFLRPTDVSFIAIQFREGKTIAKADRFLSALNGLPHPQGAPRDVGPGNSTKGCQVSATDEVRIDPRDPPFSKGNFLWEIPWEFSLGGGTFEQFTIANQLATSDENGKATIEKKSPQFIKEAAEPDSDYT